MKRFIALMLIGFGLFIASLALFNYVAEDIRYAMCITGMILMIIAVLDDMIWKQIKRDKELEKRYFSKQ